MPRRNVLHRSRKYGALLEVLHALFPWKSGLWSDARHAVRGLRRRPGFVVTALVSLALGIGANSAIFSVVDSVLLKPLPVPDSDRLVSVKEFKAMRSTGGNPARLKDWREQVEAFQSAAAWYGENVVYSGGGDRPGDWVGGGAGSVSGSLSALLHGVRPTDPGLYAAAALVAARRRGSRLLSASAAGGPAGSAGRSAARVAT